MDIRDYWRIVRKRWVSIALITVLSGALALGFSLLSPKAYSTTAQNFVSIGGVSEEEGQGLVFSGSNFALQRVKSYVELVDSPQVLNPVIDTLGLNMTTSELAKMVSATNPPQTVLLDVTAVGGDPVEIARIANATAISLAAEIEDLETPQGSRRSPVKVTTTGPAEVPSTPVSPRTRVNVALGLLLGLAAGLGWAILREQLDNTVKSPDVLATLTGSTALGIISFDPDAESTPLVALDQQSVRSEAFRTLRTNLQYIDVDNPPKAVAITSAMPSEGKTTTACNLAITLAQAGKSVCLVEGDMRRPKVAQYLGVESAVGLTDVLRGALELEAVLLPWRRGLLTVLPTGAIPPNPSELLSSKQMRIMLDELRRRFDIVIIDAAPLLPVADGAIVASVADGAVLITRHGRTTRDQVERAAVSLDQVGARLLGVALNFVPARKRGYGGYGYGYGGYGYGYGAEEAAAAKADAKKAKHGGGESAPTEDGIALVTGDGRQ